VIQIANFLKTSFSITIIGICSCMSRIYAHQPKKPELSEQEFFNLAKMNIHKAINYILDNFGRDEANYFDEVMLPMYSNLKWGYESEFQ